MWALFGIYDYYRVTGDRLAKQMFEEGISILKADIHKYDVDEWSVYAQTNHTDFVIGVYQQFINEQLRVLYAITGDVIFNKYANKWDNSLKNDHLFIKLVAREFLKTNPLH
jgi:heparosan-N-sulfate-glucuronate 5-epimerase